MRRRVTVVGCVCVCVRFDFSIQFQIGQEDVWIASALKKIELKRVFFRKTVSWQSYRIRIEATSTAVSHFVCPPYSARAYFGRWSRPRAVSVPALPLCLARRTCELASCADGSAL